MEDEDFTKRGGNSGNFIVTQKISQIGRVLNQMKESAVFGDTDINSQNSNVLAGVGAAISAADLNEINNSAKSDIRSNLSNRIKILSAANASRMFLLKKPSKLSRAPAADSKTLRASASNPKNSLVYLQNTYTDCYFGSDTFLTETLQSANSFANTSSTSTLRNKRGNTSVLLSKSPGSYEFIYADLSSTVLSGLSFNLEQKEYDNQVDMTGVFGSQKHRLTQEQQQQSSFTINLTKSTEFAPIKQSSRLLSLSSIELDSMEYLQVRSIYGLHHVKRKSREESPAFHKKIVCEFFADDTSGEYKEIFDCVQSEFFDEDQFVLTAENNLFSYTGLEKTTQLFNRSSIGATIRQPIEGIDISFDPHSLYLQMTDAIAMYDTRAGAGKTTTIVHRVAEKKVPIHRIYAMKHLQDNYFMTSTTNSFKFYDVRCTNYPVYSVVHGSDEAPPTVLTIQQKGQSNSFDYVDREDSDDDENDDKNNNNLDDSERIITAFSPAKAGNAVFMRWNPKSTLIEHMYEVKAASSSKKSDVAAATYSEQSESDDDNNNSDDSSSNQNENPMNRELKKSMVLGRENKGERLCFSATVRDHFEPKGLFTTTNAYDVGRIFGVSTAMFTRGKFISVVSDSRGGVAAQVFSKVNHNNNNSNMNSNQGNTYNSQQSRRIPQQTNEQLHGRAGYYVPLEASKETVQNSQQNSQVQQLMSQQSSKVRSQSTECDIDPALAEIIDLQVKKIFERKDMNDRFGETRELLTEPVRFRSAIKKQVNMYPFFDYLKAQAKNVMNDHKDLIENFKSKKMKIESSSNNTAQSAAAAASSMAMGTPMNSQIKGGSNTFAAASATAGNASQLYMSQNSQKIPDFLKQSQINVNNAEVEMHPIQERLIEQSQIANLDRNSSFPEFKKNQKYNTKAILTKKNTDALMSFWD